MAQNTPCILLHETCDDGQPPVPHALLSSLQRKDLSLSHAHDALTVMADVMARHRRMVGGAVREPLIVLIVEPDRLEGAWELADAVHRYAPFTVCWLFQSEYEPRLRQYTPDDASARQDDAPPVRPAEPAWEPTSCEPRLVEYEASPSSTRQLHRADDDGASAVLSGEELRMLLTGEEPPGPSTSRRDRRAR